MGRLLIDYSKNTAPLQKDGGQERLMVGMSLKYHEPDDDNNIGVSAMSTSSSRMYKVQPPNPSYPLQFLETLEKERLLLVPSSPSDESESHSFAEEEEEVIITPDHRRRRSPRGRRTSFKPRSSKRITFRLPSIATIRQRRFETQKLHSSDGDLDFLDKTNHTMPAAVETGNKRSSLISKDDANDASVTALSIQTAPAVPTKSADRKMSLEKAMERLAPKNSVDEEEEDSEDETRGSGSFLPSSLMNNSSQQLDTPSPKKSKRRKKKKKQQPSLDEWFNKGGSDSQSSLVIQEEEEPPGRSKTPTRSNRRRTSKTNSIGSTSSRSLMSQLSQSHPTRQRRLLPKRTKSFDESSRANSNRSLMSQLSQSHPAGPRQRRLLPKRTKSFDESSRANNGSNRSLLTNASTNTRRGGRRPGTKSGGGPPTTRKLPSRSKSSDCGSFQSMKSTENSFSFIAGSRIRIRRTGGNSLLGTTTNDAADDEVSLLSASDAPRRRRLPARTKSCEDMPFLMRAS